MANKSTGTVHTYSVAILIRICIRIRDPDCQHSKM